MIIAALGVASCSQPVVFQGQSTLPVTGTPPAPVVAARPPPRVEVRDNKIEIHDKIQFDFDKATIKEASFGLMNEIAAVIAKNPQIKRIRIEGHASAEGTPAHNKTLSDERAKSVMKYLTSHGITPGELVAIGYGTERPIADNTSEEGREKNRRVEFVILEQDVTRKKVEIDAATGAEKTVEENHEVVKAPDADTSHEANKSDTRARPAPRAEAPKKGS
ncbi:MAG TPA: OmpA family protein [Kofleriaceae bacterium]|nr:OmpA family protein [Kofleriaceae bacterium]